MFVSRGRLVVVPVSVTRGPYSVPSSTTWAVPVGTGVDGEIVVTIATAVPCTTELGLIEMMVLALKTLAARMVKDVGTETDAW